MATTYKPTQPNTASAPIHEQKGSGRVTNVRQYLEAQAPGTNLAQNISQKARHQAGQIQSGIQAAQNQFSQQTAQAESQLGAGTYNQSTGKYENTQKTSELSPVKMAFQNPQDILKNQEQLKQFQQLRQQQTQQPTALNLNQYQQQQQNLQNEAQLAGSERGRFQLLNKTFGQPSYSTGQQRLDQLFLQSLPGQTKQLQSTLGNLASQTGQQLGAVQGQVSAHQAALQNLANQRSGEINSLLGQGQQNIQSNIEQKLKDIQASAPQALQELQGRIKTNQLTKQDLASFGLRPDTVTFGQNLGEYLTANTPTAAGVASPEQVARLRALQQLSGTTEGGYLAGQKDIGTYTNPYNVNQQALQENINEQKQALQKTLAPLINNYNINQQRQDELRQQYGDLNKALVTGGELRSIVDKYHLDPITVTNRVRAITDKEHPYGQYRLSDLQNILGEEAATMRNNIWQQVSPYATTANSAPVSLEQMNSLLGPSLKNGTAINGEQTGPAFVPIK